MVHWLIHYLPFYTLWWINNTKLFIYLNYIIIYTATTSFEEHTCTFKISMWTINRIYKRNNLQAFAILVCCVNKSTQRTKLDFIYTMHPLWWQIIRKRHRIRTSTIYPNTDAKPSTSTIHCISSLYTIRKRPRSRPTKKPINVCTRKCIRLDTFMLDMALCWRAQTFCVRYHSCTPRVTHDDDACVECV